MSAQRPMQGSNPLHKSSGTFVFEYDNRTFPSSSIIYTVCTTSACVQMPTWRKRGILLSFATTRTLTDDFFGGFCRCGGGCSGSSNGGTERGDTGLLKSLCMSGLGRGLLLLFLFLGVYAG